MPLGPVQRTNKQNTNLEQLIKLFAPMGDRMMGESPFAGPGGVLGDPNAVENWYPEGRAQPVPGAVYPPPVPSPAPNVLRPGVSSGILRGENAGTPPSGYGTASNSVVPGQEQPEQMPTRPTRSAFFSGVPEFEPQPIFNAATRNVGSENKRTLEASGIAALLSLISGNRNHAASAFIGAANGARQGQEANYQNQFQQAQTGYQGQVQRVENNNAAIGRKRQDAGIAYEDATGQYRDDVARQARADAAKAKATPKPLTPADKLRIQDDIFGSLSGHDDETQQRMLSYYDQSGAWQEAFGVPLERGEDGKYSLTLHKAAPVKAEVDPTIAAEKKAEREQKRADDLRKQDADRIQTEVGRMEARYNDPHTTEPARRVIEARLREIKRGKPWAWNGVVPRPGDRMQLTPKEAADIALAKQRANKPPSTASADRAQRSQIDKRVSGAISILQNPKASPGLKQRAATELRELRRKHGVGPGFSIGANDFARMTPGQIETANRAAVKAFNDAAKESTIISVEEVTD